MQTACTSPTRQTSRKKGTGLSQRGDFRRFCSQTLRKGKSVEFVRQNGAEIVEKGNLSFCTMIDFSRVRGIYTTSMELDIVEIVRQFQKILW